jgi:hypothetical protein
MLVADSDYPLLEVFWTILIFFAWMAWLMALIQILGDVFRRDDIGGFAKAAWTFFLILVPFLGVLIYLIGHSKGMAERNLKDAKQARAQFDEYVRETAGSGGGAVAEIERAKALLDAGTISQADFDAIKAKALS